MSLKVYIDTNVYLDSILDRDDGISKKVLKFLAGTDSKMYLNDLSVINIHYIATASKKLSKTEIDQRIRLILNRNTIVSIDRLTIENALDSNFKDFEDGVQYFCAKRAEANLIITKNIKDFKNSDIKIMSPCEFHNRSRI